MSGGADRAGPGRTGIAANATRTLTLRNRLEDIEGIGRDVDAFARRNGVSSRVAFDANLALDEVLTNVISYAWDDEAEHEVTVRLCVAEGRLTIEVEDDGRPFDPLAVAGPDLSLPAAERPVGGLGLSLVQRLIPELRYERRDGRNVFTMSLPARNVPGPGEDAPMNVTQQTVGSILVLRASGRLDAAGAAAFEAALLARVDAGERRLVVDCSDLDYINSAGLRALLVAAKRLAAVSGAMALAGATGQIRSVLGIVGFDEFLPVCGTVEEARAAVADPEKERLS